MAAPTIRQILAAIEARLKTIPDINVTQYMPGQVSPPQASVGVPAVPDFHVTYGRGIIRLEPTVTVFTSAASDRAGQLNLADFVDPAGPKSVVTAIEGDKTLGGVVQDCIVGPFEPFGLEFVGAVGYFGGIFQLRVMASGA